MSERMLVTIVFSDAVGYSKLAHEQEDAAVALIESDFAIFRDIVAKHQGEVIKSTGDGLLMIYGSAVAGVQATLEMARALAARDPEHHVLQHRFGIHLGDVIRSENDVIGDGVNIAARLQNEAPVGGIALSRTIYDVVSGKTHIPAIRIGETQLKNITKPVEMWHIMPGALDLSASIERSPNAVKALPRWMFAVGLVAIIVVAFLVWKFPSRPQGAASATSTTPSQPKAVPASKLSVKEAKQGVMLEGANAGKPCLSIWISKDSTIPAGAHKYHLAVDLAWPNQPSHHYEVSAYVALREGEDELIQVPFSLIRPAGIPAGTRGQLALTVEGETGNATFKMGDGAE